jgi:hypothetical protein
MRKNKRNRFVVNGSESDHIPKETVSLYILHTRVRIHWTRSDVINTGMIYEVRVYVKMIES